MVPRTMSAAAVGSSSTVGEHRRSLNRSPRYVANVFRSDGVRGRRSARDERAGDGGGGRRARREALLRSHADRAREQRPERRTMSTCCSATARPQARAQVARKFGGSSTSCAAAADAGGGARGAGAAGPRRRASRCAQALASTVAGSPKLPARRGAAACRRRDRGRGAAPASAAPCSTTRIWSHVVRTNAMQYALAVAAREHVVGAGVRALVDTGDAEVVARAGRQCRAPASRRPPCSAWSQD